MHEGFWKCLWQSSVVLIVYEREHTRDQVDHQRFFTDFSNDMKYLSVYQQLQKSFWGGEQKFLFYGLDNVYEKVI